MRRSIRKVSREISKKAAGASILQAELPLILPSTYQPNQNIVSSADSLDSHKESVRVTPTKNLTETPPSEANYSKAYSDIGYNAVTPLSMHSEGNNISNEFSKFNIFTF